MNIVHFINELLLYFSVFLVPKNKCDVLFEFSVSFLSEDLRQRTANSDVILLNKYEGLEPPVEGHP